MPEDGVVVDIMCQQQPPPCALHSLTMKKKMGSIECFESQTKDLELVMLHSLPRSTSGMVSCLISRVPAYSAKLSESQPFGSMLSTRCTMI